MSSSANTHLMSQPCLSHDFSEAIFIDGIRMDDYCSFRQVQQGPDFQTCLSGADYQAFQNYDAPL